MRERPRKLLIYSLICSRRFRGLGEKNHCSPRDDGSRAHAVGEMGEDYLEQVPMLVDSELETRKK